METFLTNGTARIWADVNGSGYPLILCNGGFGCDDYLAPVSVMIEDRCEVVRFEQRGCGRSDYDGNYDLETTVADIEFIRERLGYEQVILGGHSAGVDLALMYTLQFPARVRGIVGLAGGRIVDDREWHRIYDENRKKIGESYGGQEFIADPRVNKDANRSWKRYIKRPGLLREISRLPVPVLLIGGGQDIRPSWPTRQLAELLPEGEYREIEGAAHCIWLTHAPELELLLRESIDRILQ